MFAYSRQIRDIIPSDLTVLKLSETFEYDPDPICRTWFFEFELEGKRDPIICKSRATEYPRSTSLGKNKNRSRTCTFTMLLLVP